MTTINPADTAIRSIATGGDLEHATRIPAAEITGVKGALIKRLITKKLGKVPTAVGVYWHNPKVRLPGGGGGAVMLPTARRAVTWRTEHSKRTMVEKLDSYVKVSA